jgi:hypothetical protein
MPYIKQMSREYFEDHLINIVRGVQNTGDLTYCIYKLMIMLTEKWGKDFRNMSSILSETECAKLEFYRRIMAPYEDKKIDENGDVK